jgi:hypothetical protein
VRAKTHGRNKHDTRNQDLTSPEGKPQNEKRYQYTTTHKHSGKNKPAQTAGGPTSFISPTKRKQETGVTHKTKQTEKGKGIGGS